MRCVKLSSVSHGFWKLPSLRFERVVVLSKKLLAPVGNIHSRSRTGYRRVRVTHGIYVDTKLMSYYLGPHSPVSFMLVLSLYYLKSLSSVPLEMFIRVSRNLPLRYFSFKHHIRWVYDSFILLKSLHTDPTTRLCIIHIAGLLTYRWVGLWIGNDISLKLHIATSTFKQPWHSTRWHLTRLYNFYLLIASRNYLIMMLRTFFVDITSHLIKILRHYY